MNVHGVCHQMDLLFTTSPLHKPMISPPRVPSSTNLDLSVYQAESGVDGRAYLRPDYVASRLAALQPLNQFAAEVNSEPFTSRAASVYRCFRVRCVLLRQPAVRDCVRRSVPLPRGSDQPLHRWRRRLRGSGVSLQRAGCAERPAVCSASPTTTGATARRASCLRSSRRFSGPPAMVSRRRAFMKWGITILPIVSAAHPRRRRVDCAPEAAMRCSTARGLGLCKAASIKAAVAIAPRPCRIRGRICAARERARELNSRDARRNTGDSDIDPADRPRNAPPTGSGWIWRHGQICGGR